MKYIFTLAVILAFFQSYGQVDTTSTAPLEMSLEELMNIKIVASKTNLTARETPSIVSVISREEIKNMGARDLMDVLNQVPGFSFGSDVQNTAGLGARGNWGHEGKILLLIDGIEMNEILYATTQFGQHYDISNIDRIEIIRGPGSSIYGGYAELGVINIISRTGQQMKGASVSGMYGNSGGVTSRENMNLSLGNGNDRMNYSFSGMIGNGIRSNKTYYDIYGNQTDMVKTSALKPFLLNGGLNVGRLSVNLMYDGYSTNTADQYDQITNLPSGDPDRIYFNNFYASIKYNLKAGSKVTITPRLNYKTGTPWKTALESPFAYSVDASRMAPAVNINFVPNQVINLSLGVDSYFDNARYTGADNGYFSSLGKDNSVSFSNVGAFAQGVFKTNFANFTIGARADHHSQFGSAFSPRLGITKAWPNFHIKALYSRSFKSPAIENINYNPEIKPERTGVAELELGYKLNEHMFVTVNGFEIIISDPIVFTVDAAHPVGTYGNFDFAGSAGFEIDYRIKYHWGYISTNYAYYSSKGINKVALYDAVLSDKSVLGLPSGRLNLSANFKLSEIFSINPSFNALSGRYALTGQDASANYTYSNISSQFLANVFVRAKTSRWDVGVGVYNITDENQLYIQAYSGGHAPLPGMGRELVANLRYLIPLK
ncbi:MAG TPA: TonB-dependent receptor plug domain-containing protein [Cyclobacteriaceae bacterium]|jgi:outer membrane cobalamin receptor|nr:TonB-dependent receptor plug domain-containing protein [Cyclobacteriaceae bacterium]